jgi:hypothetical protein
MSKSDSLLNDLYYKQHNYDGVDTLYKKAKIIDSTIKKDTVKEWLNKQHSKQVSTKKTNKKIFLPIYSEKPYSFQIDLTFFPRYKKQNNQFYVLFTAININTRYAYAYYGKNKEMDTILSMVEQMEKDTVINSFTCDEGTEFKNNKFIKFCEENNIEIYFVKSDSHKLGIVNRFHRTLKNKLTQHFIATDSLKWVDVIDKIIYNYNHTVNRGIGTEPYKVDSFLEHEFILYKKIQTDLLNKMIKNNNFEIGDKVRILNKKVLFEDKLLPNYSSVVYTVIKVFPNACMIKYKDTELRVKKDQLLKNNIIENKKELVEIPKLLREDKAEKKIKREKLGDVVLDRPKREKIPNKKYITI